MNLEALRSAQVEERGTDSLQPLRPSFYAETATYLADLRERRQTLAEQADDPFDSEEVRRLNDELETAEEVVEALYDRRVGKLVKRASLAAAGLSADEEGLTAEEEALFTDLVERIEANRAEVLGALEAAADLDEAADTERDADSGSTRSTTPDAAPTPESCGDEASPTGAEGPVGEDAPPVDPEYEPEPDGGATAAMHDSSASVEPDRLTVRITASVGEIYGVDDRIYTLDAEDVVTLPAPNAEPLLEREAAERVE